METTKFVGVEPDPGPTASHPPAALVVADTVKGTWISGSVLVKEIVLAIAPVPDADCCTVSFPNPTGILMLNSAVLETATTTGITKGTADPK